MKRRFGNLIMIAAVALICLLLLPTEAKAASYSTEEFTLTYSIKNGEVWITDCNASVVFVDIPDNIGSYPVTYIGGAFSGCSNLEYVYIPDSVTSIGDFAFSGCTSLTYIDIPNSVTSIGDDAFRNCTSLTDIIIPNSVTSIGYHPFYGCTSLTSIWVDVDNPNYSNDSCGFLYNKDKTELIEALNSISGSYTIPDSVTSIGDYAFSGCTSLTDIIIPDSITSIGDFAFDSCSSLTSVTIPGSVTSIGQRAFSGCASLTRVTIGNGVKSISSDAFYRCTSLTDIIIPGSVTSIGSYAFSGCTSLTGIWVDVDNPNYSNDSYGVLFNKDKTELIGAPYTISGSYTIPDSVTTIDAFAFASRTSLTSVDIPASVISIGQNAFSNSKNLTRVTIGNGVKSISFRAFWNCTSLTDIIIPGSVTSIGSYAFEGCTKLTDVYYSGTEEQWNNIYIYDYECTLNVIHSNNYPYPLLNATLHLPDPCADGHTEEIVPAKEATCTETGLTEGVKCSVCGEILTAQEEIAALGHTFDESGNCFCGAARATVTVVDNEVFVNSNGMSGIKVFAFNITDKDVVDINAWNELKAVDPSFKTYAKSSFALANGAYVLRVQYNNEGVTQVVSYKITVDYTPAPVVGPEFVVENNAVSVTANGMTGIKVYAFNITDKDVADITVWNNLKAADPSFKTYTGSSFTLKNGTYVLRVQYTDAKGATHIESREVTIDAEIVVPQATVSGKNVSIDGKGTTVSKIHAFYVEGDEIANIDSWNELKTADSSFKSYAKTQFSVKNSGAYVLRIEYVDQNGIKQTTSQLVTAA